MFGALKNLFNKSGASALGIDVGPSSIKVVQLEKRAGRAVLKTYGALALGPYAGIEVGRATKLPTEKVSEALLDLLREAATSTKKCGLSIPMSASLIILIEVPAASEKDLDQIMPIEARKYIPIPISEVALDWFVIPREEKGLAESELESAQNPQGQGSGPGAYGEKLQVMLIVTHNDAISHMQEITRLSSLDASFFEIEIFSTIRSVLDHEPEPVMILDLGAGSTKLYIVDRGILRSSHIITRGGQDITLALSKALGVTVDEAEALKRSKGLFLGAENIQASGVMSGVINFIMSETTHVMANYQHKYNKAITKTILTGGGAALKGLQEIAQKELRTEVQPARPFTKVETPAFLEQVLAEVGPEFSVAVGLALRRLQDM